MNFKSRKNKSLHLAHSESGYLCCFKTNLNPATTEANNIVPFAKKATKEVVTETVEQTAVKAGRVAGAVAGKVLGPVGLAYDVLGNAKSTAIGTFGTAPENTFNFASNPAKTLTMALNSAGELRLELNGTVPLPEQYSSINLAPDVNIGVADGKYTLYKQGETIKLALGDEISKKANDVLEIKTGEKTIEIKTPVGHNPNKVSRTELAGGKRETPSLQEQQQELGKQEAIESLNKSNTGSRAIYGGGDDGTTDGSHDTGHNEFEIDYSDLLNDPPDNPYASSYETTPPPASNYYDDLETSPSYDDFNLSALYETPPITSTRNYQPIPAFTVTRLTDGTEILSLKNQPEDGTIVRRFDGKQIVVNIGIPSKLALKLGDELTQNGITYLVSHSSLGGGLELIEQTPQPIEPKQPESLAEAAKKYLDDL